jgi:hypothetical protein
MVCHWFVAALFFSFDEDKKGYMESKQTLLTIIRRAFTGNSATFMYYLQMKYANFIF